MIDQTCTRSFPSDRLNPRPQGAFERPMTDDAAHHLVRLEAADESLTPGRYVGVAPPEEHEAFDFGQTLRDIHTELADLNKEAVSLAAKIQANFEELGA